MINSIIILFFHANACDEVNSLNCKLFNCFSQSIRKLYCENSKQKRFLVKQKLIVIK
jgi:hypothetical protein